MNNADCYRWRVKHKVLIKFILCMTSILKVTIMMEEFHLFEHRVVSPLMRVRVSLKKVHEWIKYMAIKVQDENF